MDKHPLVSIIINNYNYARYLDEAIDSALSQTYTNTEVIVVDDGSTDRSRDIVASYGDKIVPVLKKNGGQASAMNAGFLASNGDILLLLDADDIFCPNKVEEIVNLCHEAVRENPNFILSNAFQVIDEKGYPIDTDIASNLCAWLYLDKIIDQNSLVASKLTRVTTSERVYQFAAKYRFIPYLGSPTSSLVLTKPLAEAIFPLPCEHIRTSADDFLVKAASLLGSVYITDRVLTLYRIHGENNWLSRKKTIEKEFFHELDSFLNDKVKNHGKKEVFCYFSSLDAKGYYRENYGYNCGDELFRLAFKVISWHLNMTTIVFFIKTVLLSAYLWLKKFPVVLRDKQT